MYADGRKAYLTSCDTRTRSFGAPAPHGYHPEPAGAVGGPNLGAALQRRWKYLVFCALVSAGVAYYASQELRQRTFTFSSALLYHPTASHVLAPTDIYTVAHMVKSRENLEKLREEFDLAIPLKVLDKSIEVDIPRGTSSIAVSLKWANEDEGEEMLNRLILMFRQSASNSRRAAIERMIDANHVNVDRSRVDLAEAQQALAEFSNRGNIIDIDFDLALLKESLSELQVSLGRARLNQTNLMLQKGKGVNMTSALVTNRTEIDQIESYLVERREEMARVKSLRKHIEQYNDDVKMASKLRERAEAELAVCEGLKESVINELSMIQPVMPSLDPMSTNGNKVLLGAFALCGLVLVSPVLVSEIRSNRAPAIEEAARSLGLPMLAATHQYALTPSSRLRCDEADHSDEYSRLLALRIQQSIAKPGYVILFSSLNHQPAPVTLLMKLARCFADRDERVLVIDTDTTPQRHKTFCDLVADCDCTGRAEMDVHRGLADYLSLECYDVDEITLPTTIPGVDCLMSGAAALPREGLGTRRMTELLEQLRLKYTLIIIAGPSTAETVDLELLAARADGIVFSASGSSGANAQSARVVRNLIDLQAPILGVIS